MNEEILFILKDNYEYYGRNKLEGEPKIKMANIYGGGVEATLRLHIPNTKNIIDIREVKYYDRFKEFEGSRSNEELVIKLSSLKEEIQDYCYNVGFYTYECNLH